jgi:hypothetical protein
MQERYVGTGAGGYAVNGSDDGLFDITEAKDSCIVMLAYHALKFFG